MPRKRFTAEKIINMLREAKVLVERWRREYNHIRPNSSLGYRPPALEIIIPMGAQVFGSAPLHTYASETNSRSGTKVWGLVNRAENGDSGLHGGGSVNGRPRG